MARGRKKGSGKGKNYFDEEVNDAIVEFNTIDNKLQRDILFTRKIYPALNKLVENIIHKWKFYNYESSYDDLKADTVTYLYETLSKYKPETGSKAFSYFTIVARNYLIKKAKDLVVAQTAVNNLELVDSSRNIMVEVYKDDFNETKADFNKYWINQIENDLDQMFNSNREKSIANAFINVFQGEVDIDNKKLMYIYIREQLGLDTNQTQTITKTMNILKTNYIDSYEKYLADHL